MWIVSVALMTSWMVCVLLGFTFFGLTHLLCAGAVALEVFRRPARRAASTPH
ncbi:MAG: hypothetical protein IT347_03785 [Candidatus Eisenbacteria bacterium]|nr:hypothetical protein [Candidatus Eisenbacteria bacterium]